LPFQPLRPQMLARGAVRAVHDPLPRDRVKLALVQNRRRVTRGMLGRLPHGLWFFFAAARPDGAELVDAGVDQAVAERGRRDGAEVFAIDGPQLLAGQGIMGGEVLLALEKNFIAVAVLDDDGRDPVDAARPIDAPAVF